MGRSRDPPYPTTGPAHTRIPFPPILHPIIIVVAHMHAAGVLIKPWGQDVNTGHHVGFSFLCAVFNSCAMGLTLKLCLVNTFSFFIGILVSLTKKILCTR